MTTDTSEDSLRLGEDGPTRRRFLARLQREITKRGAIDVLRRDIKRGPHQVDLVCGRPSPGIERARLLNRKNRLSVDGSCATGATSPSVRWT
ncbi:MAG: hypothetical protein OXG33_11290 [Chloroflexi bacterium]|nr:hypothetical protein [Chloroflexota bacterium]